MKTGKVNAGSTTSSARRPSAEGAATAKPRSAGRKKASGAKAPPRMDRAEAPKSGPRGLKETLLLSATTAFEAAAPALMRAVFAAAQRLEQGEGAHEVAKEAGTIIGNSPEMMAAFKQAVPGMEALAGAANPKAGQVAGKVLGPLADGNKVRAALNLAGEMGGVEGKRLTAAFMRGSARGGIDHAAAEVAATASRIAAKAAVGSSSKVAQAAGKVAPALGKAGTWLGLGTAFKELLDTFRDESASKGKKVAQSVYFAATIAGLLLSFK
jgi:hypothetical protein